MLGASSPCQNAGFTAAKVETNTRRAFELCSDGRGYEFLPLAGKSSGKLGKESARFLSDLGEVAASDGCV